jgi:hypothetical protein
MPPRESNKNSEGRAKAPAKPTTTPSKPSQAKIASSKRPVVKGAVYGSRVPESAVRARNEEFGGGVRGAQKSSYDQHYGVLSPVAADKMRITQLQGNVNPRIDYAAGFHQGTDIGVPEGTEARSVKEGGIVKSVGSSGRYGNQVIIEYPDGSQAAYSHLGSSSLKPGQAIEKGQTVGLTGNTGRSTGAHLDFEARKGGVTAAPAAIWNQKSTVGQSTFASAWKGAESGTGGRTSTSSGGTVNAFYDNSPSTSQTNSGSSVNASSKPSGGFSSGQFVNLANMASTFSPTRGMRRPKPLLNKSITTPSSTSITTPSSSGSNLGSSSTSSVGKIK